MDWIYVDEIGKNTTCGVLTKLMCDVPQQLLLGQLGAVGAGGEARGLFAQRSVFPLQCTGALAQRTRTCRLLLRRRCNFLCVIC